MSGEGLGLGSALALGQPGWLLRVQQLLLPSENFMALWRISFHEIGMKGS